MSNAFNKNEYERIKGNPEPMPEKNKSIPLFFLQSQV